MAVELARLISPRHDAHGSGRRIRGYPTLVSDKICGRITRPRPLARKERVRTPTFGQQAEPSRFLADCFPNKDDLPPPLVRATRITNLLARIDSKPSTPRDVSPVPSNSDRTPSKPSSEYERPWRVRPGAFPVVALRQKKVDIIIPCIPILHIEDENDSDVDL